MSGSELKKTEQGTGRRKIFIPLAAEILLVVLPLLLLSAFFLSKAMQAEFDRYERQMYQLCSDQMLEVEADWFLERVKEAGGKRLNLLQEKDFS